MSNDALFAGYADQFADIEARRGIQAVHQEMDDIASIEAQFGDIGKGRRPSPPRPITLDIDDALLQPATHGGCSNSPLSGGSWARHDPMALNERVNKHTTFLNQLGQLCVESKVRYCENETCMRNRTEMDSVAPLCEWKAFREWALTTTSCQASYSEHDKRARTYTHLRTACCMTHWVLLGRKHDGRPVSPQLRGRNGRLHKVDLMGVCEVIYWTLTIQSFLGMGAVFEGRWEPNLLPQHIFFPAVVKAAETASEQGLCPNRVWSLAMASERQQLDLHPLMEAIRKHGSFRHAGHEHCTAGFCHFTTIDSTRMQQLHKCADARTCAKKHFDSRLLAESFNRDGSTTWSLSGGADTPLPAGRPYVAISHVWSDGTGVGVGEKDRVNHCLWESFSGICADLGAEGIWWDTISIPMERETRRKAIKAMNENYKNAEYVLVHDQYLLDFEWADDGSPCLAMVLSPWFTRGWTALELYMSKRVKVLYKGQQPGVSVVKDLDDDILAKDPARSTRAHWIASSLIRKLRKELTNVSDILVTLQPRSTSKSPDRIIIAGLLAGLKDHNFQLPVGETTKAIITHLGRIRPPSLMHGHVTMTTSDGFSWCPPMILDMPTDAAGDLESGSFYNEVVTLQVDALGRVQGDWDYRLLTRGDAEEGKLLPFGTHWSVVMKIKLALQK